MASPQWEHVADVTVPARPDGLWTVAYPYVSAPGSVRVVSTGRWTYSSFDPDCGPDGHRLSPIASASCLIKEALVGALIGKVGGGTADTRGTLFAVGSYCVIELATGQGGALFLTINDEIAGFEDNRGSVSAKVFVKAGPPTQVG